MARPAVHLSLTLACLLTAALPASPSAAGGGKNVFRAGAFAADITPLKFPVSVNGGMQDRKATAAHDRLHARCLVLDDGTTRLAFAVCDSCMIPREIIDEARQLASRAIGIPAHHILISATHTHTAPTVGGVFQSDPDPDYVKYLPKQIARGIERAAANLAPAEVGWGVAREPGEVFNRRWLMKPGAVLTDPFGGTTDKVKMNPGYLHPDLLKPAGPTDPEVSVLSVRTPAGRPLALLANYSLHYVGGVPELSADYFGLFAERIGQLLGAGKGEPAFVGILSNGTSGDINNINFAGPAPPKREPYEQARAVADRVARAAHEAYKGIKHRPWVSLAAAEKDIELGVRRPTEAEVKRAHEIIAAAKDGKLRTLPEVYARETVLMAKYPEKVPVRLGAFRVGELGIAAVPCEVFVQIGLEIKKRSPLHPTFTIELANGYNGYLPTPEQHALGGYETWRARSSYLEVNASRRITETVLALLKQVEKGIHEGTPRGAKEDKREKAGQGPKPPEPLVLREALVVRPVGAVGRDPLHLDLLEADIVAGRWKSPREGDKVGLPGGLQAPWEKAEADKGGVLKHRNLRGGYAYWAVPSDAERVMVLEASGHLLAYVNGEPRTGDPYGYGYVRLPVLLRKGTNDLLFQVGRGTLRARLVAPKSELYLDNADALLPDLLEGESPGMAWGAVVVVNASTRTQGHAHLIVQGPRQAVATRVPPLPPLSVRKVPFLLPRLSASKDGAPAAISLQRNEGGRLDNFGGFKFIVPGRRADQSHRRTFVSAIDGSVQYYAVNPARPLGKDAPPPALFLSLHGASVEAIGQANAYASKTWGHIVAPTNRRPYGFDWEDWGRLDALEVLELARKELRTDPQRTYLTGHSMGGHGVWHLGATYPDHFAAIGPSAGWVSFWTYPQRKRPEPRGPVHELLRRASNPSETLLLATNYAQHGVYVLHGDADDNVPVGQARLMKQVLEKFHRDFRYHEQPKAGHWWDASPEPGTDCVDWAPMFDFFARRAIPRSEMVRQVRFVTASPGVSARSHWVTIEAQQKALKPSGVLLQCDPGLRRFLGKTENVARLALDLGHLRPGPDVTFELDGQKPQKQPWPEGGKLWLRRDGDKWVADAPAPPSHKGPHRYGPFREVFRKRMLFVYGTKGTPEENAWALAKARYDAETFWYRGNGSVDVLPDTAFSDAETRERNVVLYGNADTNAAWGTLLKDSPVQLRRGAVTVGERKLTGEHLACLFLRPRPGSDRACVGVVGGSGLAGMRLTDRLPYFVSGVAYPDCIVLGPETLREGVDGVRVAGYFGPDWGVGSGEFAWGNRRVEVNGPAPEVRTRTPGTPAGREP